ncbi:MAG: GNAT family N-acetyltransferase [Phycisphaerales bacterium]|nr:GNAT family N-acetyltransferase [Phycisphaerales bacterium]
MSVTTAPITNQGVSQPVLALAALRRDTLRVERLTLRERHTWDRYVSLHAGGTFFHLSGWMASVCDVFPHEPHYLMARRGDRVVGVLPLFVVRSRIGGTMLVSVPYAVAGGIVCDDEAARDALTSAMRELAATVGAGVIDLRCERDLYRPLPDSRGSDWLVVDVDTHVTFKRELPTDVDDVLSWLPRKARAAARNAENKHGLTVAFGWEHLHAVWRLYCRSMRRLGSISYPLTFFESLVERYPRSADVQIIRSGARTIAGLVSFRFGDVYLPYFAGCDERCNHLQTNNYLYLCAMRRAVELGCRVFDFGRTRIDNRGSYDFKRFHGFESQPLKYERWLGPGVSPPNLCAGNPRLRFARRMWSCMPQSWCTRLSAIAAVHIPG